MISRPFCGSTHQTSESLLDELAVRRVEDDVVKVLERDVALVSLSSLALRLLDTEGIVRALEGARVAGLGQGTVDLGVLGRKAGLVEVVAVANRGQRWVSMNKLEGVAHTLAIWEP